MASFRPNVPLVTRADFVRVDPGLPVGQHRFRLVVVDDHGNRSRPTEVVVSVLRRLQPPIIEVDQPPVLEQPPVLGDIRTDPVIDPLVRPRRR